MKYVISSINYKNYVAVIFLIIMKIILPSNSIYMDACILVLV